MRNLKKLLAVIVTIAMIASFTIPAFAETTTTTTAAATKTDAQVCTDLGMLVGNGSGVTADYLTTQPDRLQGAIMVLRLKGLEAEAKAFTGTDNYADVAGLSAANKAILAYLKAHPELGYNADGVGGGKFAPTEKMTAKQFYKTMLIALGYTENVDFTWTNVMSFAAGKGLTKNIDVEKFTVNDLAVGTVEALKATPKGSTKTLVATLAEANADFATKATSAGLYTVPVLNLAISSVSVLNAKQVQVVFNQAIDDTTATAANIQVTQTGDSLAVDRFASSAETGVGTVATGYAVPSADKKTLTITLDNGAKLTQNAAATVTVGTGLKTESGLVSTAALTASSVAFQDLTAPTLISATSTGNKTVELKFSEPVTTTADLALADAGANAGLGAAASVMVDNGSIAVSAIDRKATDATVMVVTLGAALTAGEHSFKLTGGTFKDYVGYNTLTSIVKATYVADTVVPTLASATALTETTVKLVFSKDVTIPLNANIEFRYAYNITSANKVTGAGAVTKVSGSVYYVTFPTAMTPGQANIYISYVNAADTTNVIKDLYGNTLVSGAAATINVALDNVKPTVASVTYVSPTLIDVNFSEAVTAATAQNPLNYILTKGSVPYTVSSVAYKGTAGQYRLTVASMAAGGNFTLAIANVKDTSVFANTMDAYTTTFAVSDAIAPTILSVLRNAQPANTLHVQYSEAMATTGQYSVLDVSNYRYATAPAGPQLALPAGTTLTMAGNIVIITFPTAVTVGDLYIGTVADANGNKITALQTAAVAAGVISTGTTFTVPTPVAVAFTAKNTATFTIARQLAAVNAAGITTTGVASTGQSASFVNNANGTATVTVTFNANQATNLAAIGNLSFAAGALTDISGLLNAGPVSFAVTAATADGIAPEVTSVTTKDTDKNGCIDRIDVVFSEGIKTGSFTSSTFAVAGYAIASVSQSAIDSNTVYINLTEGATPDTAAIPTVTMVGTIQDASLALNTASAIAMTATVDGAAPVVVSATITTPGATAGFGNDVSDAITLVFSEPVNTNFTAATAPTVGELEAIFTASAGAIAGGTVSATDLSVTASNTLVLTTATVLTTPIVATNTITTKVGPTANDIEDAGNITIAGSQAAVLVQ